MISAVQIKDGCLGFLALALLLIAGGAAQAQIVIFEIDTNHHRVLVVDPATTIIWVQDRYTKAPGKMVPVTITRDGEEAGAMLCQSPGDLAGGKCVTKTTGQVFGTYSFTYCSSNLSMATADCKKVVPGDFHIRFRSRSVQDEYQDDSAKVVYFEVTKKTMKVKGTGLSVGKVQNLLFTGDKIVWTYGTKADPSSHKMRPIAFTKGENDKSAGVNPCKENSQQGQQEVQTGPCEPKTSGLFAYQCYKDDCDDPIMHVVDQPPPINAKTN